MEIVDKILKSKVVLKEILDDIDYDVSTISLLSKTEMTKLFELKSDNSYINALGSGSAGCNFSVKHKKIPSFILNIIYLNMPDKNTNTKLTKSFKEKILNLYENNIINQYSSSIIIINEEISETIEKVMDELNITLQNTLEELSSDINKEMKDNDNYLNINHFKRCWMFNINSLTVNFKKHRLVSEHIPIRNENKIQEILDICNCSKSQLPIISRNDIMSKYNLAVPGNIMIINRTSKSSGDYPFYRFVK